MKKPVHKTTTDINCFQDCDFFPANGLHALKTHRCQYSSVSALPYDVSDQLHALFGMWHLPLKCLYKAQTDDCVLRSWPFMTRSLGGSVCLASVHSQNLGYLAIYRDEQLLNLTVA